jgi:hypothetical protein
MLIFIICVDDVNKQGSFFWGGDTLLWAGSWRLFSKRGYMSLQHSTPAPYPLSPGKGEQLWHPMSLFHLQPCEVFLPTVCKAQVQNMWDTKTSLLCSPEPSHSVDSHPPHMACEEIALVEINTQYCKTELGKRSFSSLLPHHIKITRICVAVI